MKVKTKIFGEIDFEEDRTITFAEGIIGYPSLKEFALIHDVETGNHSGIKWLQSLQEPGFAMPVMDPLLVEKNYNPVVEDALLLTLGSLKADEMLVLVTVTIPKDITKMSINLKAPFVINAENRRACQIITDSEEYSVKYYIYDLLQSKKAGE